MSPDVFDGDAIVVVVVVVVQEVRLLGLVGLVCRCCPGSPVLFVMYFLVVVVQVVLLPRLPLPLTFSAVTGVVVAPAFSCCPYTSETVTSDVPPHEISYFVDPPCS